VDRYFLPWKRLGIRESLDSAYSDASFPFSGRQREAYHYRRCYEETERCCEAKISALSACFL